MGLLVAMAGSAAAQCGGTQLCAAGAGDCTINAACTITLPPGGLDIDLGSRRLVITRTLTVNGPAGGSLFIRAGDVLIDGPTIVMPGANGVGGVLVILSATNLTVRGGAVIDVAGSDGAGVVDLEALGGSLSLDGRIRATGTATRMGYGGEIDLYARDNLTVAGPGLDVSGGDLGGAGFLALEAKTGSATISSPLKAFGADGGDIDVSAGTTLQTSSAAQLNVDATGDAGSGGAIDLSAGGDIVINGETIGSGTLPDFQMDGKFGGDGADVDIFSNTGSITLNGRITANAAAGGAGGTLDFEAAQNLTITKPIVASSGGLDGIGGDLFLTAGGTMSIQDTLDVNGSTGSGGSIELLGLGSVTVSKSLLADGGLFGGTIFVTGCTVNITSPAILSARGPGGMPLGSNTVRASSTITIAGTLRATSQNLLEYRGAPGPSVTGSVTPPATLDLDPTLACCVSCPVTTTTTTSTTTSTTRPPTTTTSSTTSTSTPTTTVTTPPTTSTTTSTSTTSTTTTTTQPSICGNGAVTGAEQCDDGNTANGDCCSATCTFEAANAPCTNDSNACTRDVCNGAGVCTHPAGNAGATCRAAAGPCDQAETCSGTSATCPSDAKRTDVCRPAAGACDVAESCNGVANTCPPDGFASAATPCRAATGVCDVAESCTGTSSTCPADGFQPNGTSCSGNACTGGGTCQNGACSTGAPVSCGPCETCDTGGGGCIAAPRTTCRRPVTSGKANVKIKDSLGGPKGDRVMWKWITGAATSLAEFGDPVTSDGLTLCIFDRSQPTSSLLFRASVAAGGTCGTKPCWTGNGKTFKFSDRAAGGDGVATMSLIPGAAGKAKILLTARGASLSQRPFGVPRPPLSAPLTVQLQSNNGQCWESSFSRTGVKKNNNETFAAVAD